MHLISLRSLENDCRNSHESNLLLSLAVSPKCLLSFLVNLRIVSFLDRLQSKGAREFSLRSFPSTKILHFGLKTRPNACITLVLSSHPRDFSFFAFDFFVRFPVSFFDTKLVARPQLSVKN